MNELRGCLAHLCGYVPQYGTGLALCPMGGIPSVIIVLMLSKIFECSVANTGSVVPSSNCRCHFGSTNERWLLLRCGVTGLALFSFMGRDPGAIRGEARRALQRMYRANC